jgi:hypothetical protein
LIGISSEHAKCKAACGGKRSDAAGDISKAPEAGAFKRNGPPYGYVQAAELCLCKACFFVVCKWLNYLYDLIDLYQIPTTMEQTSISHIGHEHSEWLRSLDFYKQELGMLKERLTEIGGKNTGHDVAVQLEQYENRFKVQRDNIDRLRHNIKENRNAISREVQDNKAGYFERDLSEQYLQLGKDFSAEEEAVNELRREFNQFSTEWM